MGPLWSRLTCPPRAASSMPRRGAALHTAPTPRAGQNLIEKIVGKHVVVAEGADSAAQTAARDAVRAGAFVSVSPRHVMTHDNTAAVMAK